MTEVKKKKLTPITDSRLLLLNEEDNTFSVARPIRAGEAIPIASEYVRLDRNAATGFKIARMPIAKGSGVIKGGFVIGIANKEIKLGALVHIHNMDSEFLSTSAPKVHK